MKQIQTALLLCLALALVGCGDDSPSNSPQSASAESSEGDLNGPAPDVGAPEGPPPKKLVVEDLKKGKGPTAEIGDELAVYFTSIRYINGEHFETIWKPDKPFAFRLNEEEVSPGWVKGLPGMKAGGRRELIVPGPLTSRVGIPPSQDPDEATLIYVVDLLEVNGSTKETERAQQSGSTSARARPIAVQTAAQASKRAIPTIEPPEGPPPKKLIVEDLIEGSGRRAKAGDRLGIRYRSVEYPTGEVWSSSLRRTSPFSFELGANASVPGWEVGLVGMKAGGRRRLIVPIALLYQKGYPAVDPPAAVVYVIDLLEIR